MSNKLYVKMHELFGEACIFLQWWNLAGYSRRDEKGELKLVIQQICTEFLLSVHICITIHEHLGCHAKDLKDIPTAFNFKSPADRWSLSTLLFNIALKVQTRVIRHENQTKLIRSRKKETRPSEFAYWMIV